MRKEMYVVVGLLAGVLEDVRVFGQRDEAVAFIEAILDRYGIDERAFAPKADYWCDSSGCPVNEIHLREV